MSRLTLMSLVFLIISNNLLAQIIPNKPKDIYPIIASPIPYSSDSLLAVIKKELLSEKNCYYIREDRFSEVLKMLKSTKKLYVFNELGKKLSITDDNSCTSPTMYIKNINNAPIDRQSNMNLDTLLAKTEQLSINEVNFTYPTAVIFWNLTTGITEDSNPFEWERLLNEKYNYKINIVKINTDVNSAWSNETKEKFLKTFKQLASFMLSNN